MDTEFVAFVKLGHPGIVRVLCSVPEISGVILDAEHGAFSDTDLETLAALAALAGKLCIVRIPSASAEIVARALDRGATGVMIPRVRNASEVSAATSGARYSPSGVRGFDPNVSAASYGGDTAGEPVRLIVEIETVEALESVAEIAAVEGVTDIFLGPADLARELGETGGEIFSEAVVDAMAQLPQRARTSSVKFGLFVDNAARARAAYEAGYSLIAIGTDTLFLRHAAQETALEMRCA